MFFVLETSYFYLLSLALGNPGSPENNPSLATIWIKSVRGIKLLLIDNFGTISNNWKGSKSIQILLFMIKYMVIYILSDASKMKCDLNFKQNMTA